MTKQEKDVLLSAIIKDQLYQWTYDEGYKLSNDDLLCVLREVLWTQFDCTEDPKEDAKFRLALRSYIIENIVEDDE